MLSGVFPPSNLNSIKMEKSPFKPVTDKKNRVQLSEVFVYFRTLANAIIERYKDAIPSDDIKNMPSKFMLPVGTFLHLCLLAVFLVFFISQFLTTKSQHFLAYRLDNISNCADISLKNTGIFLADQYGNWQGSSAFSYPLALYHFDFFNYNVSQSDFAIQMSQLQLSLASNSAYSEHYNLGPNILLWCAFFAANGNNPNNVSAVVYMESNPSTVLNRAYSFAYIVGVNGTCAATASTYFDTGAGAMIVSYEFDDFNESANCLTYAPIPEIGQFPPYNAKTISYKIDVRSLILCAALNARITKLTILNIVPESTLPVIINDQEYRVIKGYDQRYPGMSLITCAVQIEDPNVLFCGFYIGSIIGVPILNQKGYSQNFPSYCECDDFDIYTSSEKAECNYFQFIYGFMFWTAYSPSPILTFLTNLYNITGESLKYRDIISHAAYNASFIGSYWGQVSPLFNEYANNSAVLEETFKFCYVEGYGYCSILAISAKDLYPNDFSVSTYYYQLMNGSCSSILAIPNQYFQNLVTNPFTNLVQDYQTCINDDFTNVVASAGIATGNVGFLTPFAICFSLLVAYLMSLCFGFQIPYTYDKQERSYVLDALALNLLLARDENRKGKLQSKNAVLLALVEELSANSNINPYVIDDFNTSMNIQHAKRVFTTSFKSRSTSRTYSDQLESKNPMGSGLELHQLSGNANNGNDLISLNSSKSSATRSGDGMSSSAYLPKLQALLSELKECIGSPTTGDHNNDDSSSVRPSTRSFWEIIVSTNEFNNVSLDINDPDAVEDQYYIDFISALRELMLLHAETSLGIDQAVLKSHYRDRIFYSFVGSPVVTLADLDKVLTMA